jgi:hypothetical protein
MENQSRLQEHYWTQDLFLGAAIPEGMDVPTSVQRYKCTRCDLTMALPDCYHKNGRQNKTCLTLLSLGCCNDKVRPPLPPRKEKAPYEDRKDYPKKKAR